MLMKATELLNETANANIGNFRRGEVSSAREVFYEYMDVRAKAMDERTVDPPYLAEIQEAARKWILDNFDPAKADYAAYDIETVVDKIDGVTKFLIEYTAEHYPGAICDSEIHATELFIKQAFAMYDEYVTKPRNGRIPADADAKFAFVVPSRTSTLNPKYGGEAEIPCPITRYIPNELRGFLGIGLPPFIVDQYNLDNESGKGYLINASLYPDMLIHMPFDDAKKVAQKNTNDGVAFAKGLGAKVAGLGALIPALTKFGKTISVEDINTTTGHAGTIYTILQTAEHAVERGYIKPDALKRLGCLGLGAIGNPLAEIMASHYSETTAFNIFDYASDKISSGAKALDDIGKEYTISNTVLDLLNNSDVIVSAITSPVDLDKIDPDHKLDLTGKLIIDDSQPGMFNRDQVEKRGGTLVWVIAHDTQGVVQRKQYSYDTLVDEQDDLFGCEAEAGALSRYYNELCYERGLGPKVAQRIIEKIAVRDRVTTRQVRLFGVLFRRYGIIPAPFQVLGELVPKQNQE